MAIVLADAGPLIALAKIGQLHLLRQLFQTVTITESVRVECLKGDGQDSVSIKHALKDGWLINVEDQQSKHSLSRGLGSGESTSIEYAIQTEDSVLLIIDDALARKQAMRYRLNFVGITMIIFTAQKRGIIDNADTLIGQLKQSGYRISGAVIDKVKHQLSGQEKTKLSNHLA